MDYWANPHHPQQFHHQFQQQPPPADPAFYDQYNGYHAHSNQIPNIQDHNFPPQTSVAQPPQFPQFHHEFASNHPPPPFAAQPQVPQFHHEFAPSHHPQTNFDLPQFPQFHHEFAPTHPSQSQTSFDQPQFSQFHPEFAPTHPPHRPQFSQFHHELAPVHPTQTFDRPQLPQFHYEYAPPHPPQTSIAQPQFPQFHNESGPPHPPQASVAQPQFPQFYNESTLPHPPQPQFPQVHHEFAPPPPLPPFPPPPPPQASVAKPQLPQFHHESAPAHPPLPSIPQPQFPQFHHKFSPPPPPPPPSSPPPPTPPLPPPQYPQFHHETAPAHPPQTSISQLEFHQECTPMSPHLQNQQLFPEVQSDYSNERRLVRTFRGGGEGLFGHDPRDDGWAPTYGMGSCPGSVTPSPPHSAATAAQNSSSVTSSASPSATASASSQVSASPATQNSAMLSKKGPATSVSASKVRAAPVWLPRRAWCEVCDVDCGHLSSLRIHKGGKRHKKQLMLLEQLQQVYKTIKQSVQTNPNSGTKSFGADKVEDLKGKQLQPEVLPSLAGTDGKPVKLSKAKHERIPCKVCNIVCYSQYNLEQHLRGKKHIANLEMLSGDQELHEKTELQDQTPHPPNCSSASLSDKPQLQKCDDTQHEQVDAARVKQGNVAQVELVDVSRLEQVDTTQLNLGDTAQFQQVDVVRVKQDDVAQVEQVDVARLQQGDTAQIDLGDAELQQLNVAQLQQVDVARVEQGDADHVQQMDVARLEQGEAAQLGQVDAARVEQGDAVQVEQMDVAQLEQGEAAQLGQVDAAQLEQVDATQLEQMDVARLEQVDATKLKIGDVKLELGQVNIYCNLLEQVDVAQLEQVDATQLEQMDVARLEQGNAAQLGQVDAAQLEQTDDKAQVVLDQQMTCVLLQAETLEQAMQREDTMKSPLASSASSAGSKRKSSDQNESEESDSKGNVKKRAQRSKDKKTDQYLRKPEEIPKVNEKFLCKTCNCGISTKSNFKRHLSGKKHIENVKKVLGVERLHGNAVLQAQTSPQSNCGSASLSDNPQLQLRDVAPPETPEKIASRVPNSMLASVQALVSSTNARIPAWEAIEALTSAIMKKRLSKLEAEAASLDRVIDFFGGGTNSRRGTKEKDLCVPRDNSVATPPESAAMEVVKVPHSATLKKCVSKPEFEAMTGNYVEEDPEEDSEEEPEEDPEEMETEFIY